MKKIIATSKNEVDTFPFDCFSISHLNGGIIVYFICFFVFSIFILPLAACFLSYITALVGGLIWEFFENGFIVDMKMNKRQDSPINSLIDVALVFLGSIIGCYLYNTDWMIKIIIIGSLFLAYFIARILTLKNKRK